MIGDCLYKGIFGLISYALPVGRGRRLDPLLIILSNVGHLFQGSSGRIELLIWNAILVWNALLVWKARPCSKLGLCSEGPGDGNWA